METFTGEFCYSVESRKQKRSVNSVWTDAINIPIFPHSHVLFRQCYFASWDLRSRRCVERFSNNDGTITSALAASQHQLAVGAESGVVNLYSEHSSSGGGGYKNSLLLNNQRKEPLKSIMNLHTSAECLQYNHDGQILAMSTRREKHGMKLLHVPSRTVFSNWPTSKTPLNYIWSMDFSPQSQFLAMGNDKGKCLLYRLLHYEQEG